MRRVTTGRYKNVCETVVGNFASQGAAVYDSITVAIDVVPLFDGRFELD